MPNAFAHSGATPGRQVRNAPLWTSEYFTGLYTNRSILRGGGSRIEELYLGPRGDALTSESLNTEISTKLTPIRRPGSSVFNAQTWNSPNSFYSFRLFGQANNTESIKLVVDQADAVYDGSNGGKLNIWSKAAGSGQSYFQSVADILYFGDGAEQKKWINSAQSWSPKSIYSDTNPGAGTLTDFIVDPNGNLQVAVGGFTLLTNQVQVASNVLTLTLDTAQLSDPAGTPTGVPSLTGGNLPAGNWYAVIVGVDAYGNTTEGGTESAVVATTGSTGSILWNWTPVSGVSSYRIYIGTTSGDEDTYFTQTQQFYTSTPTFLQTDATGTAGTPPTSNTTVLNVPENLYRMTGVKLQLSEFTTATFLNGQTVTISSILPGGQSTTQITAAFTHSNYGPAADTGAATSGTGISGSTQPTWSTVLNAVTQDGVISGNLGAQWINRGYSVENWGLAAPLNAPSVGQSPLPSTYPSWQANTLYWRSGFITTTVSSVQYIFQITTGGITGVSVPTWNTTTGSTTTDGTVVWTCQGTGAWASGHSYTKGQYILGASYTANTVFVALNAGVSGANQNSWTNPTAGSTVIDGGVVWQSLGYVAFYQGNGWPFNPSISVSASNTILDSNGYLQQVPDNPLNAGGSGATATATISGGHVTAITVVTGGSGYTDGLVNVVITGGSGLGAYYSATVVGGVITGFTDIYSGAGYTGVPTVTIQAYNTQWISGNTPPTWGAPLGVYTAESRTAPITGGVQTTIGIAFLDAMNSFYLGQTVTASGLTALSFLNGDHTIIGLYPTPVGTEPNAFVFQFAHSTTSPTSDSGTATLVQTNMWLNIGGYTPAGTGVKKYGYAYQNSIDDTVSDMSPASLGIMVSAGNVVNLTGSGSPDLQTDTVVIYATDQGGATYFQLDTIANPGPAAQWTYQDTQGDAGLNIEIEAATDFQNAPPPLGSINLIYHLNRLFVSVNNTVYWSTGPDTPTGNGLNGFSPSNYAIFPSLVKKLVALSTGVLVFTVSDIYILYGSATANSPLTPYPYALGYGLGNYNACDSTGGVIYFYSTDSQVLSLDPNNGLTEVGFPIADQFTLTPWSPLTAYMTWHNGGTRDKALFVADGVGDWFRMCATPAPETGITWSPKATIVEGAKCVQSVETAPGVHQLLIGPSAAGPILVRDWNTYADNEQAYPAYFTIGSMVLAHPGQVAELGYVTFDSVRVGKPLVPSVRIDEISGPFEGMARYVADPPQLVPSRTLYSNRHYFAQTNRPAICRHIQLKISWEAEDQPSELLSSCIFGGYSQER